VRHDSIPTKTLSGQAEMDRREMDLPWRARALLVAIRGQHTVAELRQQFRDRGDIDVLLEGLMELGLIDCPPAGLVAASAVPHLQTVSASKGSSLHAQRLRAFLFRRETAH
jgi:hypothetical protein